MPGSLEQKLEEELEEPESFEQKLREKLKEPESPEQERQEKPCYGSLVYSSQQKVQE